jgi:hypothetical protein
MKWRQRLAKTATEINANPALSASGSFPTKDTKDTKENQEETG